MKMFFFCSQSSPLSSHSFFSPEQASHRKALICLIQAARSPLVLQATASFLFPSCLFFA